MQSQWQIYAELQAICSSISWTFEAEATEMNALFSASSRQVLFYLWEFGL